jgi:hypothetical protein
MTLAVREDFHPGVAFDANNLTQRYIDLRFDMLSAFESNKSLYYDTSKKPILTIGYGFNLEVRDILALVLAELGAPPEQVDAFRLSLSGR